MPETIGAAIIAAIGAAEIASIPATFSIGAISVSSAALIGNVVLAAASIGANYALSAANRPKPKSQAVQQTLKQSVGARMGHYGRVMTGGTYLFWDVRAGIFHQVICTGADSASTILSHWFGQTPVTPSTTPPYSLTTAPWTVYARIQSSTGLTPVNYTALGTAFPGVWTSDHKLLGLTTTYLQLINPGAKLVGAVWGSGAPQYRMLAEWRKCYDPRTGLTVYTDNAALCILDFLTRPDGYAIPMDRIYLPDWIYFANLCDRPIPLLAGGTEPQFRIWGSWSFTEPRKNVLARMFSCCDGRIVLKQDGKIGVTGGEYLAPNVTLDESNIVSSDVTFYAEPQERVTEIIPKFTSALHDYQEVDAAPWVDTARELISGKQSSSLDLDMCPSHTQAQRLAKIAGMKNAQRFRAEIAVSLAGINAWQEPTIRVIDEELEVNAVCEVKSQSIEFSSNKIGMEMSVIEIVPEIWAWDPAIDEKPAPPIAFSSTTDVSVETPSAFTASVEPFQIDVVTIGARLRCTWNVPTRVGLGARVEWRRDTTGSGDWDIWQTGFADAADGVFVSPAIQNDGSLNEVRMQFTTAGGTTGPYSNTITVTATSDPNPPDSPTITSATGGVGLIDVTVTMPSTANVSALRLYRNTTNSLSGATLFGTFVASPNQTISQTVTGFTTGTRWVIAQAVNGSGVASTTTSGMSAVVT